MILNKINHLKPYIFLHLSLLLFSVGGILSKAAAGHAFLSFSFIALYAGVLFIFAIYAVLWQQILKHMPLNVAYSNRAIVVLWGMLWGRVIFSEEIRLGMIVGAVIIVVGIILVVNADE